MAVLVWGCTQDTVGPSVGPAFSKVAAQSGDFDYIASPPNVAVSPATSVPQALPFCTTKIGTLICYSPQFLRTAYNFPATPDGSGQTIVIVDAFGSPTIASDLAGFDAAFRIPAPPSFTIVCPDGGCPVFDPTDTPHDELGWSLETSLDVEYAHAMAPGANIVLVVAATSSGNAINVAEAAAIQRYPGSIMSQSFGIPEIVVHNNNAQIAQAQRNYAAAQQAGITVLASAGDFGAPNRFQTANAQFPASSPLVTGVAGTQGNPYAAGLVTLTNGRPTGYGGEAVWNEPRFGAATGGAPSALFAAPAYQSGLNVTTRTVPDVAYNAAIDGGVLVLDRTRGGFFIVGGTSAGSPQWAAIVALANQLNGGPLGAINPTLYAIGSSCSANAAVDFHDITVGNNQLVGTPVGFSAGTGWDGATGWGTPNVAKLVVDLVTPPACP
jgi:subtilase family serine protease